ncbi:MAG: TonB-dependent receptor [Bacteroidetes bacterium HGW-Bacteroidetes-1]|nr:MAG: TonB-dependent receptor [Bacteroidetes bacterium HGW-Bacteroidetes-1]
MVLTVRKCLLFFILLPLLVFAQQKGTVTGRITDERGKPVELTNISLLNAPGGITSDFRGRYEFQVPSDTLLTIAFTFVGYKPHYQNIRLVSGEIMQLDVMLFTTATVLPDAVVRDERLKRSSMMRIDPKSAQLLPTVSGGIEDLIKTLPGVSSNNELSSQYTVRGGNFDENLVYVNGIEIYKPFLIRAGQQEGLSFLNSALVSGISFSAGGFAAEYGDKLSSVLDITYKKPTESASSVMLSLLGADIHTEGALKNNKMNYLFGARYKTTQYILNALETKGQYRPDFVDIQSLINFNLSQDWEISFLGYYARNEYKLIPETRTTDFGTIKEAYRLTIYFDGQEVDKYSTGMGALTITHRPNKETELKLIASAFSTIETETYDIKGQYWIGRLETAPGSEQFGNVVQSQGVGTFLDHARNYFDATVLNIEHKGTIAKMRSALKWGARYQFQRINDRMNEWELLDSAGFTLPRPIDDIGSTNPNRNDLVLNQVARSHNVLDVHNLNAFLQQSWNFIDTKNIAYTLTAGLRMNYWGFANEWMLSPRISATIKPDWNRNTLFRLAVGVYTQSPFYREMRLFDGMLHPDVRSQRSYQLVGASDVDFTAWNRPFVFTSEIYYKYFDRLIPYEVDNVRIRYYADQQSKGYATGIDFKVNGEFVTGIESWASLSFMTTSEDVQGDFYDYYVNTDGDRIGFLTENKTVADTVRVFPGMIPRPTDQLVQFSLFFQDYIPYYPSFRVHLKLLFGSRLPFGPPNTERYQQTRRMPEYRRVDIGFSKQLIIEGSNKSQNAVLQHIKNMWVSLEVFNLLQINNTISYIWVKDVNNIQYGVPNYLTPRQLNLKFVVEF